MLITPVKFTSADIIAGFRAPGYWVTTELDFLMAYEIGYFVFYGDFVSVE